MKRVIYIILVSFLYQSIHAINCRIDFNIKGLEKQKIVLACEYGNKQIVIDTIKLDTDGKGFYSSKVRLVGGIYVLVFPNQKYFELLINEEQFFSVITDTSNYFKNLVIEGSEETDLYRQYQLLALDYDKMKLAHINKDILDSNHEKINEFSIKIIHDKPNSFIASYFKMQREPEFQNNSSNEILNGKDIFTKRYQFIKAHYFDNIQFTDVRLLRTRLIYEKLNYYFNNFISQNADSICLSIDNVINLSKTNNESYRFVLNFLNLNYRNAKTANQERALVHLADNYYLNDKAPWADKQFLKLLKQKVDAMRLSLIGVKGANLELQTAENSLVDIYNTQAEYLIVYFWSPDCGQCKIETNKLYELYLKYKSKGVKVLAIYVHSDKEIWKTFIVENKLEWINAYDPFLKSNFSKLYNVDFTPKLYILDSNKTIVTKNINVEAAERYLSGNLK